MLKPREIAVVGHRRAAETRGGSAGLAPCTGRTDYGLRGDTAEVEAIAAEHVPRLADLVEDLVSGNPHEVWVHEFDNRAEPTIQGHAAAEAGKRVFADWGAKDAVWVLLNQALGSAVGATFQAVNVFTEDHDARVGLHAAIHHGCDGIDESNFFLGAGVSGEFFGAGTV